MGWHLPKWKLFILAVIALGVSREAYRWLQIKKQSRIVAASISSPNLMTKAGIPASCANKKYCVTVFVAPWCPACHASEATFKALTTYLPKQRPEIGFGVVIGAASRSENAKKKNELNPVDAITDDSGQIMKLRQISSFPTWVVIDQEGNERGRKSNGIAATSDEQIKLVLKEFLGL